MSHSRKEPFGRSGIDAKDFCRTLKPKFGGQTRELLQSIAGCQSRQSGSSKRCDRGGAETKATQDCVHGCLGRKGKFCQYHIIPRSRRDGLSETPTVVRLSRMAARGRLVPAKYLIVVFGMAVTDFRVVLGTPDVPLDPQILLPKLVDKTREGPKQASFHSSSQRSKALWVGLVFLEDGRQASVPLAQRLFLGIRNVAQVGFGHPRHGVRGRERIQQHPAVVGDHAVQLVGEIGPQLRIAGEK